MRRPNDLGSRWRWYISAGAWVVLTFLADHLFGGFTTDVILRRVFETTGIHEGDVATVIFSHLIVAFIVLGLLLMVYAAGRAKTVIELSPNRLTDTSVSPRGYVTAADAVKHIADEAEWGRQMRAQPANERGMRQIPRFAAIDEFVRAAREGEIVVLGRFNSTGEHRTIAQPYWLYATVDPGTVLAPDQAGSTISTSPVQQERPAYFDALTVSRAEVSHDSYGDGVDGPCDGIDVPR